METTTKNRQLNYKETKNPGVHMECSLNSELTKKTKDTITRLSIKYQENNNCYADELYITVSVYYRELHIFDIKPMMFIHPNGKIQSKWYIVGGNDFNKYKTDNTKETPIRIPINFNTLEAAKNKCERLIDEQSKLIRQYAI